jgi:hypothetical protein
VVGYLHTMYEALRLSPQGCPAKGTMYLYMQVGRREYREREKKQESETDREREREILIEDLTSPKRCNSGTYWYNHFLTRSMSLRRISELLVRKYIYIKAS